MGKVTIMDGSTGYVLLRNGLPEDDMFGKIWSARALLDEAYHQLIILTHKSYMEVGATTITTNSYATQPTYYENAFGDKFEELMLEHAELSARLAVKARTEYVQDHPGSEIKILGSLPPLVESHRPDKFAKALADKGERFFIHHYKQLASALLRGNVDILLFETLNCWEEARLGLEAMVELGVSDVPIFVSFEGSIRDEALIPQPHLAPDLCEKVLHYKTSKGLPIEAISWNCAPPEDILQNLEVLKADGTLDKLKQLEVGMCVYANMHEREVYDTGFDVNAIDASEHSGSQPTVPDPPSASPIRLRRDLTQTLDNDPFRGYVKFTHKFAHDYGVSAIGGCCGCGPLGIQAVHKDLHDHRGVVDKRIAEDAVADKLIAG